MSAERDEVLAMVEVAILGTIFTLALFGNLFVLIALLRYSCKYPLSRMYWFMLHLSIADLMVACFNVLPQMLWDITYRFKGGDVACRVVKYMQVMPLYLSSYILVMMALDRFRAVIYTRCCSFGEQWSAKKSVHMMVGIAWIIAIVFSIPQPFLFSKQEVADGTGIYDCWVKFNQKWGSQVYATWFVICIFFVPLAIMATTQVMMCVKVILWGQCMGKGKVKTVWLTLVVIIAYIVCWSPWCVTIMVMTFSGSSVGNHTAYTILLLLTSLNACTNPWIYLGFSGHLLNMICSPCGKVNRGRREHSIGAPDLPDQTATESYCKSELPLRVADRDSPKTGGSQPNGKNAATAESESNDAKLVPGKESQWL
ncbi:PREDICTED: annetocin receptor-like [Priapulus caudatus]|uniref:Annetocin receptor-like n=1 Tax=Priapulus caudatus TaxID=37621 RepID=A0ABM1DW34_PRICU|nr:PREDICTED: annetocin receptor-like [Priapulus caudatus]XP_014664153.1 PREDICTED: annetocin receptor-like [Priapulus caudatus]XP_014664154.1 PREDICTED: annetocin receptor-like [Priapulus caudatus]XP_014664155.1 PREDICTED: annetocin receptor-like [Priapulus caudatus]